MDSIHGRALAQDGPDRRPLLQRLPRRARHQARRGPRLADQPRQRRQDLRQVPRRHRGDLRQERPRPAPGQGRQARAGLHRLPHRPRGRDPAERPLQDGQRPALRQVPPGPPEHYRDTYHGKAMALGKPNVASDVAACYDCHGHHDVLPPSDPGVAALQDQHPGHLPAMSSRRQRRASPNTSRTPTRSTARTTRCCTRSFLVMTALLVGVFAFFGVHTVVWLVRAVYLYLHDSKKFREAKVSTQDGRRMVHPLPAVRALPALPGGHQLPAAGHHRHAAQVLLHRLGQGALPRHRRRGNRPRAAPLRRDRHLPLFRPARGVAGRQVLDAAAARIARPANGQAQPQAALAGALRPGLDDAHLAGLARFRGAQQVVLRQGPQAAVRPLDLLGEVRLLRRVLGRRSSSAPPG